jgi:hypothetical protein
MHPGAGRACDKYVGLVIGRLLVVRPGVLNVEAGLRTLKDEACHALIEAQAYHPALTGINSRGGSLLSFGWRLLVLGRFLGEQLQQHLAPGFVPVVRVGQEFAVEFEIC